MDVSFNNVLEVSRQYFMGVPKPAQSEGSAQSAWPGAPLPEEGAPAQSGAPAPSSRPPSAAAAPPAPSTTPVAPPPRPPSEPIEPEPHIIHKATVMREAAEKRREMPEVDDEEEPAGTLSPPSHIIRKPSRTLPSPAPAPAAPCPSPARPPSAAPLALPPPPEPQIENPGQYRPPVHQMPTPSSRPPDPFAPSRLPDPYSASRPPEQYARYHYESTLPDGGRNSHGLVASPQPSVSARHSPQTYARMSSSISQNAASRLREAAVHSPPAQRYALPQSQPPPPHNDRVPPIYHPHSTSSSQRPSSADVRSSQMYPLQPRRETSPYARVPSQYDRQSVPPPRKYDPQQAYPGYRPTPPAPQILSNQRVDTHQQHKYKHPTIDNMNAHYSGRSPADRSSAPSSSQNDPVRLPPRIDYPSMPRAPDGRSNYHYPSASTSSSRYSASAPMQPIPSSSLQPRTSYRTATVPKNNYDYPTSYSVQTSPGRLSSKPGYPSQQARMTVSVTSIVNQMNQCKQKRTSPVPATPPNKQKRESPLDLSVKTVKNSADSSTTQDDVVDSATMELKTLPLQPRPSLISSRNTHIPTAGYVASHKVDFAPNFTQYGDRSTRQSYSSAASVHPPVRYNGSIETRRVPEQHPAESPHHTYPERNKYSAPIARPEFVPKIDLTKSVNDQRHPDSRVRDDRNFVIEERKRSAGPIVSNIPEKMVRYESGIPDSRMAQSAREQRELMSQPVYSYSSHKQFEAYQNEQKRATSSTIYRDHHVHGTHRYPNISYPADLPPREPHINDYHNHFHDRTSVVNNRHHIIHKMPSHRDVQPHHLEPHNRVPANKSVLSILRNSLETKQTNYGDPIKTVKPDIIVIDDADDADIEITDLTKEIEQDSCAKSVIKPSPSHLGLSHHHIKMPKAVDSIQKDSDFQQNESTDIKVKSPENDVASRIRTKAELKVMPPSQDNSTIKSDIQEVSPTDTEKERKLLPKSQKQHLFNQIREDLRLESVIKCEKVSETSMPEVKTEPMNIEEIERDAEVSIKTEVITDNLEDEFVEPDDEVPEDLDWASACDNFMEQLMSGCHKKKAHRKRLDTIDNENDVKPDKLLIETDMSKIENPCPSIGSPSIITTDIVIKQEPIDEDEIRNDNLTEMEKEKEIHEDSPIALLIPQIKENTEETCLSIPPENQENKFENNVDKEKSKPLKKTDNKNKNDKKADSTKNKKQGYDKIHKNKMKTKLKSESSEVTTIKKEPKEIKNKKIEKPKKEDSEKNHQIKTVIKEELESTDDDEPLIKSKIMKEKEKNEQSIKYQLLKDLSEKSAYVKLEFCDVNKNSRKSLDAVPKEEKPIKNKLSRQLSRSKVKSSSIDNISTKKEVESSTDSDDDLCVATRLRMRKNTKPEVNHKTQSVGNTPVKSSQSKKLDNSSNCSTPARKTGFGDGSDFHPGWEEELFKYKRSLRMPTRLIAIPRGRSGGPIMRGSGAFFTRGTTSLPDLDPAPLSPAPSSAPSAATDDLYARRPDKLTLDSDLDSNSSYSAANRLQYDSEASTSTIISSSTSKKKRSSIVDVLMQKCGKKGESKKKSKDKDDKTPKVITKNTTELLATPSLGLVNNNNKGSLSAKKEKLLENISYLGAFRKETVANFRHTFINNTDGLIGATEEFSPVVLKTRTRTESRVLKQRATIREVFGDERPASAPPSSCRDEEEIDVKEVVIKKEPEAEKEIQTDTATEAKKLKAKKIRDKLKRSSSIREGLRSTKSLKRNDAKGRLMRLKKRNSIMKSLQQNSKRVKEMASNKNKSENTASVKEKPKPKEGNGSPLSTEGNIEGKKRFKRLFGRRKLSSGFDYIRKKKKIIRREDGCPKIRRPAIKPSPESIHDIHKEIKGWFINKSVGETHLHRAARLGYTDCVAYCLEKMEADPSAKDNAGFTPLHVAAQKGHLRIARLLLQYGANVSAAAQGGIRPLHEACENSHVEVIRLLLSYGADPLLGTYAGQTPEELTEGAATMLLKLHIADIQGLATEPWKFPSPAEIIDPEELGCDPLASPPPASPPPPPDSTIEIQCTEVPLPPFYSLRSGTGQPAEGLWCLLQDITTILQIKSKESLLKQIHCGSGSPKELFREIRTQEFLERAQCHQLLCAGEKVNIRASKVALVRVTDKLRQLLKIETVLVS